MTAWRARWIAAPDGIRSLPIFRRVVPIGKPVACASMRLCGLGHFELRVNSSKVGDEVLVPAWTDYRRTCLYRKYDVTDWLNPGRNVIEVWLGNGMYRVLGGRYRKFKGSFGPLKCIGELDIRHTDGSSILVVTDEHWECLPGPITFSCIYGGEDYDARREPAGELVDAAAHRAAACDGPGGILLEQTAPPSRVMHTFDPTAVREVAPGIMLFDLGQNFSGWPAIRVRGPAGACVRLTPGELLDDVGRVCQHNTGRPVTFSYTLAGRGDESWQPRFSLTGFRYVEVEVQNGAELLQLTGQFVHADLPMIGHFECSNDLLNRIHRLILSAIRSNLHGVLTDCPHREKLGWLEQAHLMGPSIACNFDIVEFYRKLCRDMRDAQQPDGCVPTIVPRYTSFNPPWDIFNDSPEWGSAIVLCPWLIYQRFGDFSLIEENFDAMARYADYLRSRCDADGIISYGLSDWYDIEPGHSPGFCRLTSPGVTATTHYLLNLMVLERSADRLGLSSAAACAAERVRVRRAFNTRFFNRESGFYDRNSQCANAMALAADLVEDAHRQRVLDHLIADIRQRNNHITAGDIGFRYVVLALSRASRHDVLFDVLTQTDPPSYAAQLAAGCTSLAEAWDANRESSHNHLMLGHAESWFYEHLAGIQIDHSRPEDRRIVIHPAVVGDVAWASARIETSTGPIGSSWLRERGRFELMVTIPAGQRAMVVIPADDAIPIRSTPPASELRRDRHAVVFQVAAGRWQFASQLPAGVRSG